MYIDFVYFFVDRSSGCFGLDQVVHNVFLYSLFLSANVTCAARALDESRCVAPYIFVFVCACIRWLGNVDRG